MINKSTFEGVNLKKAIIIASSQRRVIEPKTPIPALDRYSGVSFRIVRKYKRERKLRSVDILIVSEEYGVLTETEKIPYDEPFEGKTLHLTGEAIEKSRKSNLERLKQLFSRTKYSEIFVDVGKDYLRLIDGFEDLTSAKVTYASGKGLGLKARHLMQWIKGQNTQGFQT
jgi:hypothetical protein